MHQFQSSGFPSLCVRVRRAFLPNLTLSPEDLPSSSSSSPATSRNPFFSRTKGLQSAVRRLRRFRGTFGRTKIAHPGPKRPFFLYTTLGRPNGKGNLFSILQTAKRSIRSYIRKDEKIQYIEAGQKHFLLETNCFREGGRRKQRFFPPGQFRTSRIRFSASRGKRMDESRRRRRNMGHGQERK